MKPRPPASAPEFRSAHRSHACHGASPTHPSHRSRLSARLTALVVRRSAGLPAWRSVGLSVGLSARVVALAGAAVLAASFAAPHPGGRRPSGRSRPGQSAAGGDIDPASVRRLGADSLARSPWPPTRPTRTAGSAESSSMSAAPGSGWTALLRTRSTCPPRASALVRSRQRRGRTTTAGRHRRTGPLGSAHPPIPGPTWTRAASTAGPAGSTGATRRARASASGRWPTRRRASTRTPG